MGRIGHLLARQLRDIVPVQVQAPAPEKIQSALPYIAISRLYRQLLAHGAPSPAAADMTRHIDTWVDFDSLGLDPAGNRYRKTFAFSGDYINAEHRVFDECKVGLFGIPQAIDIGIEGYLCRPDALKLYELAYFCKGDILELGTHQGLSTSIMLRGVQAAGRLGTIYAVDIDGAAMEKARSNISALPLADQVIFNNEPAESFLQRAGDERRRFGLMFVDHWHGYEATRAAAAAAMDRLDPGGFLLFHDFLDPANRDLSHPYGVYQAVAEVIMPSDDFTFYGNFGACGLFRKESRRHD